MTIRPLIAASVLVFAVLGASCSDDAGSAGGSPQAPHWEYEGEHGPEAWGALSADFAACSEGLAQSPIDLSAAAVADLPDLAVDYAAGAVSIVDNGHTVQANDAGGGNMITVDGTQFTLLQMHFHTPSEHTVNGEFAPAEVHFVHRSEAGELAVIGVMLTEGDATHEAWAAYTAAASVGEGNMVDTTLEWPALLPTEMSTIRYAGSLTTPPCTEGVRWMVMDVPVALAAEQLEALAAAHEGNHRPVQALNDREVLTDDIEG
jgi:carbonic anhydrase